jgi:hypothetical protein
MPAPLLRIILDTQFLSARAVGQGCVFSKLSVSGWKRLSRDDLIVMAFKKDGLYRIPLKDQANPSDNFIISLVV